MLRVEVCRGLVSPVFGLAPDWRRASSFPCLVVRRERDVDRFKDTLRHLLDKGGFDEIREEDFEAALEEKSMMGLEVQPPSKEKIHYELFYRGVRRKQVRITAA